MLELEKLADTAMVFGCSFKAAKVWLLQEILKLLGTLVGSDGLMPDPEKVKAVEEFAEITSPKVLKEFLGTIGFIRPSAVPPSPSGLHPCGPFSRRSTSSVSGIDNR